MFKNVMTLVKKRFWAYLLAFLFVFGFALHAHALEEVKFIQSIDTELEQPIDAVVSSIGNIVVLDRKLAKVFNFSADGELKFSFSEKGSLPGQLYKPQSIALSRKGEIIVADTGNSRVQVFLPDGQFAYELGGMGFERGQFKKPVSVAVDQLGYIFVADADHETISKFSPNGIFLETTNVQGSPADITFDLKQNLYILFPKEGHISVHSAESELQKDIVLTESEHNYISSATSLAVDTRGDIYIIELTNHSIIKMDQNANMLFTFGSNGIGKGQFDRPAGLFADTDGNILVADSKNKRVQVFAITGSSKMKMQPIVYQSPLIDFKEAIHSKKRIVDLTLSEKGLYALFDENNAIRFKANNTPHFDLVETSRDEIEEPTAFHVFKDGSMLLTDTGNHRLLFLNPDGSIDYKFGTKGSKRSEFYALQGVTVDREGYIYIADTKNHRIQVFNQDGIYLRAFGQKSQLENDTLGSLHQPKDLVFNSNEELFVLDYRNKRIQVFTKDGAFLRSIGGALDANVQFVDIIDIDVDEYDFVYVADRGDHAIKILDSKGSLIKTFGSLGKGPSHFPKLSAVASSNGKIYVSDYSLDTVRVYHFQPDVMKKGKELLYLTRVSHPLEMKNTSEEIKLQMARKLTLESIKEDLIEKIGVIESRIDDIQIVEEQNLGDGRLQITVSIPKNIIPKEFIVLGMKK